MWNVPRKCWISVFDQSWRDETEVEAVNATALCCCDSNSLTSEKKHGRVSKAPRGKKSPWPPPPLHTHCQILINRRLPSFIDESVYIKIQVPPVRRGSHPGSGSWLRSGLGERLSASWRKSTVLDTGIVPPHLLRFTSRPWVCEPTGHVDFRNDNKKAAYCNSW